MTFSFLYPGGGAGEKAAFGGDGGLGTDFLTREALIKGGVVLVGSMLLQGLLPHRTQKGIAALLTNDGLGRLILQNGRE